MRKFDRKVKLLLLLPLFSFLFGCGSEPEYVLKNDIVELQKAAVNCMFAEKIMENPDATAYVTPGSELVLISDEEKQASPLYDGNSIILAAAYYKVEHISCTVTSTHNRIKEYKKKPFTCKAQLQVNFQIKMRTTDLDKNRYGTPGLEFHTLVPDSFYGDKDRWLENLKNEIPESQYNHAVAIHRVTQSQPSEYTENRIFEIFYNSRTKQWEFGDNVNQLTTTTPLPVYSEKQHEEIMKGYKRQKFTARNKKTNEQVILWVRGEDWDSLDKILNQNLVKVDGVWKKWTVGEHTRILREAIKKWDKKDTVSLEDLEEILLKPIQECVDAENRAEAIALAKKAIYGTFLQRPTGVPTKKDYNFIKKVINFIRNKPYTSVFDREDMLKVAQQEFAYIEECVAKQEKEEAERRAEEAARRAEEAKRREEAEAFRKANREQLRSITLEIQRSIENYGHSKDLKKLLVYLRRHPDYNNTSVSRYKKDTYRQSRTSHYTYAVRRFENLANIAMKESSAVRELYDNGGHCYDYRLLINCRACRSSGLKSCNVCRNSGRCTECGGAGRKYVGDMNSFGGGGSLYLSHSGYIPCSKECRFCRGRTVKCRYCFGKRYKINMSAVNAALDKELNVIRSILVSMLDELENN